MKRFFLILLLIPTLCWSSLALREGLERAAPGDFIVTAQNKSYTMLLIQSRNGDRLNIEEITIPMTRVNLKGFSWRDWIKKEAPDNTSWVRYTINMDDASMEQFYSFTKRGYYKLGEADNFLSKLLNLEMEEVPLDQRKRVGPRSPFGKDTRRLWKPQMVIDGEYIKGVDFAAYKTRWPKDGTELSDRCIEIYVPEDSGRYPSYFPYWLQVYGMVGKAKIRIVDSGRNLTSPKPAVLQ